MTNAERVLAQDAFTVGLEADQLSASDILVGDPAASSIALFSGNGVHMGVWELTEGTVTDVEIDEVFIVLAGRGHVSFDNGDLVKLEPGVAVLLRAGERSTWTITEALRKVYVIFAQPA